MRAPVGEELQHLDLVDVSERQRCGQPHEIFALPEFVSRTRQSPMINPEQQGKRKDNASQSLHRVSIKVGAPNKVVARSHAARVGGNGSPTGAEPPEAASPVADKSRRCTPEP